VFFRGSAPLFPNGAADQSSLPTTLVGRATITFLPESTGVYLVGASYLRDATLVLRRDDALTATAKNAGDTLAAAIERVQMTLSLRGYAPVSRF
jgi:hypothetical protein